MISRIVEGSGASRRVAGVPLDGKARESQAKGLCQYLGIKAKR